MDEVECPECADNGPFIERADGDFQCPECGEIFSPVETR